MYILAFANQKGGVGKSTNSLNLCYALSNTYGKKVLLVDMDSQGSSSLNLGIDVYDYEYNTIEELLYPIVMREKVRYTFEEIEPYIYTPTFDVRERDPENRMKWITAKVPFGFDLIPASLELAQVELHMGVVGGMTANRTIYAYYLRDILDVIDEAGKYDFVVIDTPPSLGSLSVNSMAAAKDGIIVSSSLDIMSIRGIRSFLQSAKAVTSLNPNHRGVLGILLASYYERRLIDRDISDYVREFLPIPTFDTKIPESSDVKKANSSLMLYAQINKKAKAAYDSLAEEVLHAVENPQDPVGSAKMLKDTAESGN